MIKKDLRALALTNGSKGATLYSVVGSVEFKPKRVEEVDPTGSGDPFAAVLTVGILTNAHPAQVLAAACQAGTTVASKKGVWLIFQKMSEVLTTSSRSRHNYSKLLSPLTLAYFHRNEFSKIYESQKSSIITESEEDSGLSTRSGQSSTVIWQNPHSRSLGTLIAGLSSANLSIRFPKLEINCLSAESKGTVISWSG